MPQPSRRAVRSSAASHAPFRDALRAAAPASQRAQRYRAGLLALEYADQPRARRRDAASNRQFAAVRRAVDAVRPVPARAVLRAVVDAAATRPTKRSEVGRALTRYAAFLQSEGEFALANHVYRTVVDGAPPNEPRRAAAAAHLRLGLSLREPGDRAVAMDIYKSGLAAGARRQDAETARAIGVASAAVLRLGGEHAEANAWLERVLRGRRPSEHGELDARALQERGVVAYASGKPIEALEYYAAAYDAYSNRDHRNQLLVDIARSLRAIGRVADAREALTFVRETARERCTRWMATIELMSIAVAEHKRHDFERHARALARAPMPARLSAAYQFERRGGYAKFKRPADGRRAYQGGSQPATPSKAENVKRLASDILKGRAIASTDARTNVQKRLSSSVTDLIATNSTLRSLSKADRGN